MGEPPSGDDFGFPLISGIAVTGSALIGLVLGLVEEAGSQERVAYEGPITQYVPETGEEE